MTTRRTAHTPPPSTTSVVAVTCVGLATTVLATIVPYLDRAGSNTLARHIRAGYPQYTAARIDTAATTYLVYLTVVGLVGCAGWLWTLRALATGRRWARAVAAGLFVLGAGIALTDALIKDTSGDTGLPALLGWAGVLPCLPGGVVVYLLWRRASPDARSRRSAPQRTGKSR